MGWLLGELGRGELLSAPLPEIGARQQGILVSLVADARWHAGIGDPTPLGWLTVVAYGLAAVLCARAVVIARSAERRFSGVDDLQARNQRSMKHLWLLIGILMVLLGVNKQLDLQTLVIQRVRRRAYVDGWYGERRRYQVDFIISMTIAGAIAVTGLCVWLRRVLRRVFLVIVGIGLLVLFVLIRASSFHYVDRVLSLGGRVRINWIIELSGIGLIVVAALHFHAIERREFGGPSTAGQSVPDTSVSSHA
jgi:hypothetical protein